MSKLEDKLTASIKTRRPAKPAATRTKEPTASSAEPALDPATTPAAVVPAAPAVQPLPSRRVWPD